MQRPRGVTVWMRWLLLPVLGAGCVRQPPVVVPAEPALLSVVTWNMDAGRGNLSHLVQDLASGALTGAPAQQFAVLLQEVTEVEPVAALARAHGLSLFYSPVEPGSSRPRGNAILSTRVLIDARSIQLPRERQPRSAVTATIELEGRRMFLASAHLENRLDWWRGGPFSESARARQAVALLGGLPGTEHGIVGGDMNTLLGVREPALRAFIGRFPDTPTAPSEPTFGGRLVLDHVFFDLPERWVARRIVIPNRYGSDHHPVLGVVTVEGTSP